jgi:hypothetical protein
MFLNTLSECFSMDQITRIYGIKNEKKIFDTFFLRFQKYAKRFVRAK